MKNIILPALLLLLAQFSKAQNHYDVYLKNGTVMRGTILQQGKGTTKFRTDEGAILLLPAEEIQKFRNLRKREREAYPLRDSMRKWERKILAGFSVCPDVFLRQYRKVNYDNYPGYYRYAPGGGFAGGFAFAVKRGPLGFETGIFYRTDALRYTQTDPYAYLGVGTGTESPMRQTGRYHSVGIPFALNLLSVGKKVRFFASFGFSADLTVSYTYTNNYEGTFKYYFPKAFPYAPSYYNNDIGNVTTLNGHVLAAEDRVGIFDEGIAFLMAMGVEANLTSNAFLRIGALCYGAAGSLGGGMNVQVLFNAERKK